MLRVQKTELRFIESRERRTEAEGRQGIETGVDASEGRGRGAAVLHHGSRGTYNWVLSLRSGLVHCGRSWCAHT